MQQNLNDSKANDEFFWNCEVNTYCNQKRRNPCAVKTSDLNCLKNLNNTNTKGRERK